jgi:hypothetical protein
MPPQGDLSSDVYVRVGVCSSTQPASTHPCCSYRSFVRDSQTSVPLPSGASMSPACIGLAREKCLSRSDVHSSWLNVSTCQYTNNVGSHPLFHKSLELRVLGCDPRLLKVCHAASCLESSSACLTPLSLQFDEAVRFFLTHTRKPCIEVDIRGYHIEWQSNFDGNAYTVEVEDWRCQMDITDACSDRWSFISAAQGQSFDAAIAAFCDSKVPVKSLGMDCAVEWNWDELRLALERLVQSTGWNGKCSITFPRYSAGAVGIISSNRSTRLVTNAAIRGIIVAI